MTTVIEQLRLNRVERRIEIDPYQVVTRQDLADRGLEDLPEGLSEIEVRKTSWGGILEETTYVVIGGGMDVVVVTEEGKQIEMRTGGGTRIGLRRGQELMNDRVVIGQTVIRVKNV